ncbi:hypothetical protein GOP47_0026476 [Adiantum capillus-veneris]|nr:hypothetical protein GOP47_0026476 [Adiantum capillus-veneris]
MEAHLLSRHLHKDDEDDQEGGARVLYRATFKEREDAVVRYESTQWVLLSLVLLLAWGAGLFMLLYLPFRRYAVRKDVQSRRLYITTNAIVYKVEKPIFFPCFGVNRREKHILLSLVTDVAIEQGFLQSAYGIHSIKIENASRRKPPPGDDLQIVGVDNPRMFRKVVLMALSNLRRDRGPSRGNEAMRSLNNGHGDHEQTAYVPERSSHNWAWQQGTGLSSWQMSYSPVNEVPYESPSIVPGDVILQKLDDIGKSIKRIEVLIEQPRLRGVDSALL